MIILVFNHHVLEGKELFETIYLTDWGLCHMKKQYGSWVSKNCLFLSSGSIRLRDEDDDDDIDVILNIIAKKVISEKGIIRGSKFGEKNRHNHAIIWCDEFLRFKRS